MADYSQVNNYSAKDALATGNPLKLIKGSDIDAEFSALSVAVSSKFDSTDIATAGEAQAGVSNTVIITPARLTAWGQNSAGLIEDIQALADPGGDRIMFWDDSANTATFLVAGTGLDITGTTLSVDASGFGARTLTAGVGLSGGGDLSADRTFTVDLDELPTEASIAAGDFLAMVDITDSGSGKVTFANLESTLSITNLTGYVADESVDHTAVTITAGSGLSYSTGGTDISASATIDLDINELTVETTIDVDNDNIVFYDASATANRKVSIDALVGDALGDGSWYRSSLQSLSAATEATVAFNAADADNLQRGTFSTSTGEYTNGAAVTRLLVSAQIRVTSQAEAEDADIKIQVNGTTKALATGTNRGQYGASDTTVSVTKVVTVPASGVLRIRAINDGAKDLAAGVGNTNVSIVELG